MFAAFGLGRFHRVRVGGSKILIMIGDCCLCLHARPMKLRGFMKQAFLAASDMVKLSYQTGNDDIPVAYQHLHQKNIRGIGDETE